MEWNRWGKVKANGKVKIEKKVERSRRNAEVKLRVGWRNWKDGKNQIGSISKFSLV